MGGTERLTKTICLIYAILCVIAALYGFPVRANDEEVLVRIVNGTTPNEGNVQVLYQGVWGTVCSYYWSIKEANVICRQLGYPSASQAWQYAHFGQGSGPIILGDVACNGNASYIDQCDHSEWFNHRCSHHSDVGVTCDITEPLPTLVRLVNGNTTHEGRVEVYYQCQWGTICHRGWSIEDANVICRQLGYPSASQAWQSAHFGEGSGPILLSNVACNGDESNIDQCDHSGWFNHYHYCRHDYDAGVTCDLTFPPPIIIRLVGGNSPYEGRVDVYYQDQWGTVCSNGWSIEEADVICRQLGYPSASQAWRDAHFGQGSGPILLDNVACNGNESNIDQCNHSGWFSHSCSHQEDVGVTCGEVIGVSTPSPVSVRLVNGDTDNKGSVEVFYNCQWGTVCGRGWSIKDANVICRQLGYPSASQAWRDAHFGQGSGPILLNNVACNGDESNIEQCDHSGWFIHNCRHSEDAGVTCDVTTPPPGQVDPSTFYRTVTYRSHHQAVPKCEFMHPL